MTRKHGRIDNSTAAHANQRKEYYEAMISMSFFGSVFFIVATIYVCALLLQMIF
jgi:hypothetical protein